MKRKMKKIAIAGSIACLLLLYILCISVDANKIDISKANKKLQGEWVKIEGKVKQIKQGQHFILIDVCDTRDCITAIAKQKDKVMIKKYDTIEIVGKINSYKGKVQIQTTKITRKN